MPRISQLPSLTTADNSDEIAIVDVSASTTKKITRGDLLKAPLPNNSVTTAAIANNAVTASKLGPTTFQSPDYTGGGTGITVNSYTAPSNGYLNVRAVVNTTAASGAIVSIDATEVYKLSYSGPTGGYNIQSTAVIPIRAGQVATFSLTNASWDLRVFRAAIPV